jgi:polyferredoxin
VARTCRSGGADRSGEPALLFFWIEIWPHEFYFVAGLLIMAGLGLFLFTSALGRVWCGYTCPQTVWTDLFILVERWIEGDRNARLKLWNQRWDLQKLRCG